MQARTPPASSATSTSLQRGRVLAKRTPKQIAASLLEDMNRKNADLVRQLEDVKACNERISAAAQAEVCQPPSWIVLCSKFAMIHLHGKAWKFQSKLAGVLKRCDVRALNIEDGKPSGFEGAVLKPN